MGKSVKPQVLKLIYGSPIVEVIKMPFCYKVDEVISNIILHFVLYIYIFSMVIIHWKQVISC